MPQKKHFVDYEPVTRSAMPKTVDGADRGGWSGVSGSESNSVSSGIGATGSQGERSASPAAVKAAKNEPTRNQMLKRGHGLSFAGLFLFTVVVYFRPYELFSWLSWATSMAFVIAMLTLVVYVPTQLGMEGNITYRPRDVNLVLLLLLMAALSVPLSFDRTIAWNAFTEYLKVVVMFIVMVNVVRTEKRLKAILLLALITSCVISAAAVNDFRMGIFLRDLARNRIKGSGGNLFDNPNDLALHLVTMVPLAFGMLLGSRGGLKKLFFAGSAVLIIAGVVATFSRGGFVGLVCVGAVLAWRLSKSNKFLIAAGLPITLLLFLLLAPGGYTSRITSTSDDSGMARREELKRSLFVAIHHPLFGVGMNNYILYSDVNHATHNAYTEVASEMGFPAMVIYILFMITPLKGVRRISRETSATRRRSQYYYLAVGLEASLIGYMVCSFFLSVAYLWYVYYLVGYAICFRRLYEASQVEESGHAASLPNTAADKSPNRNRLPDLESRPTFSANP